MALVNVPLVEIADTGARRAYLKWRTAAGRWEKQEITEAQYAALGNPPALPTGFVGGVVAWRLAWESRNALAIAGRPVFNSVDGDAHPAAFQRLPGGRLLICLDDLDNGIVLLLDLADYTGTPPNITLAKPIAKVPGLSIVNGIMTVT